MEHELKLLREADDETMTGQRASRHAKWMETSQELRNVGGFSDPEQLRTLAGIQAYIYIIL